MRVLCIRFGPGYSYMLESLCVCMAFLAARVICGYLEVGSVKNMYCMSARYDSLGERYALDIV